MKILLIDPPFQRFMDFKKYYTPLGLLYIAAELQKRDHTVWVYDADYNPEGKSFDFLEKMEHYPLYIEGLEDDKHAIWGEVEEVFDQIKPDIVGISLISTKLASGMEVARRFKKMGAKRIVCGGPHVSIKPEEVLSNPYVDSVIVGEGEDIFEDALKERKIVAERIIDLDRVSFPARERLYNLFNYAPKDLGMIISSRGCPFNCSFCCSELLWGRTVVYRSLDNIMDEITFINKEYGTTDFYIIDDDFTCNKKRTFYIFIFCLAGF